MVYFYLHVPLNVPIHVGESTIPIEWTCDKHIVPFSGKAAVFDCMFYNMGLWISQAASMNHSDMFS